MYSIIEQQGKVSYGVTTFLCDTIEDLQILPPCEVGSKAEIIDSGLIYVLNNQKEWMLTNTPSGVSGDILQVVASNSQAVVDLKLNKVDTHVYLNDKQTLDELYKTVNGDPNGSTSQAKLGLYGGFMNLALEHKEFKTRLTNLEKADISFTEQLNTTNTNLDTTNTNLNNINLNIESINTTITNLQQDLKKAQAAAYAAKIASDTNVIRDLSVVVDIRYFAEEYHDKYNLLYLDDPNYTNLEFVTDMTDYLSSVPALNMASLDKNTAKYVSQIGTSPLVPLTIGNQFSIELYGVFRQNKEILNDCSYSIETTSNTFNTWYTPVGGPAAVNGDPNKAYDLSKAHHIVVVGDKTKLKLYIDGEFNSEINYTIPTNVDLLYTNTAWDVANTINIGGLGGDGSRATDYLIRFRVLNNALTDKEVFSLFTSYRPV